MADQALVARRSTILGTAGHIDHGKTALVRALTGVDTDRLQQEKARGITIELGFAELDAEGTHFGVVDVPGHEAFVRAMVAGAAGMDVVLLVVAGDEGVMPQTREHLAIVELLDVAELVVALTKADLVEAEWLELVEAEVAETLEGTRFAGAPTVRTSSVTGAGLPELVRALAEAATRASVGAVDDITRLPLDRVFTIQGTGTVVTGTVWSGAVSEGDRVRVLPQGLDARVRTVQVHGRRQEAARAGDRAALALTGDGADRDQVERGATMVTLAGWEPSRMLTVHVRLLIDTGWMLEHNQRVHVHVGTAEVRARCALLEPAALGPGEQGWVQLRLEEPLVARAGDRVVLRAYSPVTTIGGGVVAEPHPPKRNRIDERVRAALHRIGEGDVREAVAGVLALAGWTGADRALLPVLTGRSPQAVEEAVGSLMEAGAPATARHLFSPEVGRDAERLLLDAVMRGHEEDSLRAALPVAAIRPALPTWSPPELADAVLATLVEHGVLESHGGGLRAPGHEPTLSRDQEEACEALRGVFADAGLAAPTVDELPEGLRARDDLWSLVRRLEETGVLRQVADGLYMPVDELEAAARRVRDTLGGRSGLGPADFRDALPVTRKHLIPLLNHFDGRGTTVREGAGRAVPAEG